MNRGNRPIVFKLIGAAQRIKGPLAICRMRTHQAAKVPYFKPASYIATTFSGGTSLQIL